MPVCVNACITMYISLLRQVLDTEEESLERDINRMAKLTGPNVETASPEASNAEFLTCCGGRNPVTQCHVTHQTAMN